MSYRDGKKEKDAMSLLKRKKKTEYPFVVYKSNGNRDRLVHALTYEFLKKFSELYEQMRPDFQVFLLHEVTKVNGLITKEGVRYLLYNVFFQSVDRCFRTPRITILVPKIMIHPEVRTQEFDLEVTFRLYGSIPVKWVAVKTTVHPDGRFDFDLEALIKAITRYFRKHNMLKDYREVA